MQRSENRGRLDATLQPRRNQFRTDGSNVARQPQGMSARPALPSRRNHITQKVRIGGRTLYLSGHDDQAPAEIFLHVKGDDCTPGGHCPLRRHCPRDEHRTAVRRSPRKGRRPSDWCFGTKEPHDFEAEQTDMSPRQVDSLLIKLSVLGTPTIKNVRVC